MASNTMQREIHKLYPGEKKKKLNKIYQNDRIKKKIIWKFEDLAFFFF